MEEIGLEFRQSGSTDYSPNFYIKLPLSAVFCKGFLPAMFYFLELPWDRRKATVRYICPWRTDLEGISWITKAGATAFRVVKSDPELQEGVGREKALATGGLSPALGSDLGNHFTFPNFKFFTFKARERLRKLDSVSSWGPSNIPVTEK